MHSGYGKNAPAMFIHRSCDSDKPLLRCCNARAGNAWHNLTYIMEQVNLLNTINSPEDLRRLPLEALPKVCDELREDIIKELSRNPGHFASSLGTVELTVALHYVFDTPEDRIVWDVGHQAYGHKILTGRRDKFSTNRQLHGLHPFPTPEESPYDTFVSGHASNSISAALGMAVAARLTGHKERQVVAVIGDGAMSGGLAFEGLNNVSETPNNMLIILNDNNMSIDRSVGGMKDYLLKLNTSETYNRWRFRAARFLDTKGMLNDKRRKGIIRLSNAIKSAISHQQNIFEGMNIRYFGPFDGHDVKELVRLLRQLKRMSGPKLLHLHTQKGHGYKPAEQQATIWHAPGKFDVKTGKRESDEGEKHKKYQDVFGETLLELARMNPKIVGITPAMPTGCSMNILINAMPERAFDVGIAEGHAVTFASGLAKDGMLPFCNIYSAFSQRAIDNIIHDAAILRLPVVLCLDRAGLVGQDGETHQGAFDICLLRSIPNIIISAPCDEGELRSLMYTAQKQEQGPFVIRYPRGRGQLDSWHTDFEELPIGKGRLIKSGVTCAILTLGTVKREAMEAISIYENTHPGRTIALYDMRFAKPLDAEILEAVGNNFAYALTIEDGAIAGGFGSAVMEWLSDHDKKTKVRRLGLPDEFIEHGKVSELKHLTGLDAEGIVKALEGLPL